MSQNYTNQEILHVKKGDIEYLQFKIFNQYSDRLKHCIALKHGGVGPEPNKDYPLTVRRVSEQGTKYGMKNLEKLCSALEMNPADVCKGKQDHTDRILVLTANNKKSYCYELCNRTIYDAYITQEKNIAPMVITADCNPIMMYDPVQNVIANVHSGWKGTISQIYLKTLEQMSEQFGTKKSDVIVCIGPSIRQCCFSSQEESFKEKFLQVWPQEKEYIKTDLDGTFYIDLLYVIQKDLVNEGVKEENIKVADICTACHSDDFFSYRMFKKNQEKEYECFPTMIELI